MHQLAERLETVFHEYLKSELNEHYRDARCTIHAENILIEDSLYQLLDYYPRGGNPTATAGRAWSNRFGLIGRVWRTKEDLLLGNMDPSAEGLIGNWSVSPDEAGTKGWTRDHSQASF